MRNNPVGASDPTGRQSQPSQDPLQQVAPQGQAPQVKAPTMDIGPFRITNPPLYRLSPGEHDVQELGVSIPAPQHQRRYWLDRDGRDLTPSRSLGGRHDGQGEVRDGAASA